MKNPINEEKRVNIFKIKQNHNNLNNLLDVALYRNLQLQKISINIPLRTQANEQIKVTNHKQTSQKKKGTQQSMIARELPAGQNGSLAVVGPRGFGHRFYDSPSVPLFFFYFSRN